LIGGWKASSGKYFRHIQDEKLIEQYLEY